MSEPQSIEYIHNIIRGWILENKIEPGKKINQIKIAEELKVSRTPIVKALHKLATEGLVDNIPQRGFFVHQITLKELHELFILRESLEKIIICDIVERLTKKEIRDLEMFFIEFTKVNAIDVKKYSLKDQQFHTKLFELSNNSLVKKINETFQVLNRTFLSGLVRPPKDTLPEHLKIIETLKMKDVQGAVKIISEHDGNTQQRLLQIMDGMNELGINTARAHVGDIPLMSIGHK